MNITDAIRFKNVREEAAKLLDIYIMNLICFDCQMGFYALEGLAMLGWISIAWWWFGDVRKR